MKQMLFALCATMVMISACKTDSKEEGSAESASQAAVQGNVYDTIYKSGRYLVLAARGENQLVPTKTMDSTLPTLPPPSLGAEIPDGSAVDYINAYRRSTEIPVALKTGYMDFTLEGLLVHLDTQTKLMEGFSGTPKPIGMGFRIYPGIENGKINAILGLTYQGQAVWLDRVATDVLKWPNPIELKAYNFSGLCPEVCGDDEDKGKLELKK